MSAHLIGTVSGVTRKHLFEFLNENGWIGSATSLVVRKKMTDFVQERIPTADEYDLSNKISWFSTQIVLRWKRCYRNKKDFLKKHIIWLNEYVYKSKFQSTFQQHARMPSRKNLKEFNAVSTRTKRRRSKKLVSQYSPAELAFATRTGYTKEGKRNIAFAIKKATISSPEDLAKIKKLEKLHNEIRPFSPEEALALFVDVNLTKSQYIKLRESLKNRGCNLFPAYSQVLNAKKQCYPSDITVTETMAEIKLQSLLDHTAKRLCSVQQGVIDQVMQNQASIHFQMIYKWGFDGSSNHSTYKQIFQSDDTQSDSDLLLTSIVPLRMLFQTDSNETIIWQNPRSSSTRFCIPLKLQFVKETRDNTKQENEHIEQQISSLIPTSYQLSGKDITISHTLLKTMLDGKVANTLTDNPSSQTCYICKATPKDMNKLNIVTKKPCNNTTFQYGLSVLHANIRFFECLLHISYRLESKKWRVQGPENKRVLEETKKNIITKFRQQTGLLVDTVKQGSGNTNDGNTARRFFKNPKQASEITGVNQELIYRFSVILQAVSCGFRVNTEKFRKYAFETAELFVKLYEWYNMPASVHKILIHGADIMETLFLPIGLLSEEALEARHKECRYFRQHKARKTNRKDNMEDLLHALLLTSDMVLSSKRPLPRKKLSNLMQDVQDLLNVPEAQVSSTSTLSDKLNSESDSDYENSDLDL